MKCPRCRGEDKKGANFSIKYRQKFEWKCPPCARLSPPAGKLCEDCNHRLIKPRGTLPAPSSRYFAQKFQKELSGILLLAFLLLSASQALAVRPLMTDHAWTVEKGNWEIEAGFDGTRQDNHDREYRPSLTFIYGLLEQMDVGIESGYLFAQPKEGENKDGADDTGLKVKYRLVKEKARVPEFTLSGKVKFPTASKSKGLGTGEADFGLNALAAKNLNEKWVLYFNLGYTFVGEAGANDEVNYSFAAQFSLTKKWTLVGEIVGYNNFNGRTGDDSFSVLIGTTYLIRNNLVWDAGLEKGMNSGTLDFRVTTGFTLSY